MEPESDRNLRARTELNFKIWPNMDCCDFSFCFSFTAALSTLDCRFELNSHEKEERKRFNYLIGNKWTINASSLQWIKSNFLYFCFFQKIKFSPQHLSLLISSVGFRWWRWTWRRQPSSEKVRNVVRSRADISFAGPFLANVMTSCCRATDKIFSSFQREKREAIGDGDDESKSK